MADDTPIPLRVLNSATTTSSNEDSLSAQSSPGPNSLRIRSPTVTGTSTSARAQHKRQNDNNNNNTNNNNNNDREEEEEEEVGDDTTSFDSILGDDDDAIATERAAAAAAQAPVLSRLWGSSSGAYYPVDVEAGARRQQRVEPIWSRRMLLLPAMLLLSMGALAGIITAAAWLRDWRDRPSETIDPSLFPSSIDRARLSATQYAVRLIHTNDVHARFHPHDANGDACDPVTFVPTNGTARCTGGSAYVKAVIDHLRGGSGVGGSVLVNAGDEFQGSVLHTLFAGNVSAQMLNAYAYDAVTLGNHEFDHGPDLLARYLAQVHMPAICANLRFEADLPALQAAIQPFAIIDRHKVGIIGVLTPETMASSRMGPSIAVTDAIGAVNRMRARLNQLGIHRVVVLSHMGYDYDMQMAAQAESGISLIVGGHTHSYLGEKEDAEGKAPKGAYPTWIANRADSEWQTAIVQAKSYGDYVGVLDLVFNDDGSLDSQLTRGHAVLVDAASADSPARGMRPSQQILDLLRPYEARAEEITAEVIGNATAEFPAPEGRQDPHESALGNLVADALVWSNNSQSSVALLSTGSLRRHLPLGALTRGDLMRAMPFDDSLGLVTLNGTVIREIVRAAAITGKDAAFSTLQASGLRYTNATTIQVRTTNGDAGRPMADAVWEPLDDNGKYKVVAPLFVLGGGDQLLPQGVVAAPEVVAPNCRGIVELYIKRFSPIAPILDQRK
ncbi:hypothetical protein GGI20_003627 [Coemansia sp. BCRC 34301]|nr:hypothetical protein GGI20_003627 [Coemansia sp. BCRC 34301]